MTKLSLGAFVFPACAAAYTAYSLIQQITDEVRNSLLTYALSISIPIFILIALAVIGEVVAAKKTTPEEGEEAPPVNLKRPALLFGVGVVTFLCLEPFGYLIAFPIFMVGSMLILELRSPAKMATVTACTMAFVHFLFVEWLELSLPAGIFEGVL